MNLLGICVCSILSFQIILASGLLSTRIYPIDSTKFDDFLNNSSKLFSPEFLLRKDFVRNQTLDRTFDESTCVVGSIRDQFYYALALLESPHPEYQNFSRANKVIRVGFEDFMYKSKYYGYHQWNGLRQYAWIDEFEDYDSNYVNFLGPYLAYIMIEHSDKLEPETLSMINKCYPLIVSVLYSIHNSIDYTNMYLLRCAGLLMFGILYKDVSLVNTAKNDFIKYVDMILEQGFPEYNSPNYVYIDIWALQCLFSYAPDEEFKWYVRAVLEWFYLQYVLNFHPTTGYIAGTSDRVKAEDYYWGKGSHSNIFYQYFGYEQEKNEVGSSGTRIHTCNRYYPSDYIGTIAINKTYPLVIEAINYGIESYNYLTENYTLGTRSGAHAPEFAGTTKSDLSGEALELMITYNSSYPTSGNLRRSAWFDTNPHYNVFNSLQSNGTAITTVNFDIDKEKKDDAYFLYGSLGEDKGIQEIRINNTIWDGDPVIFNHETVINLNINDTFIALRPIPTKTAEISTELGDVNNNFPCILKYEQKTVGMNTWNELMIYNYVYKHQDHDYLPPKTQDLYSGYCIEVNSKNEIGDFNRFCDLTTSSSILETYNPINRIHTINYTSNLSNVSLYLAEILLTNRIIERKINETVYQLDYLLKSKYCELRKSATIEDLHGILNRNTFEDTDSDGILDDWETTFGMIVGIYDSNEDLDGDGLTNIQEYYYHTNPLIADTDSDGLSDYDETIQYLGLGLSPIKKDSDNDGVIDSLSPNIRVLICVLLTWVAVLSSINLLINLQNKKKTTLSPITTKRKEVDNKNNIFFMLPFALLIGSHIMELITPVNVTHILYYYSVIVFLRLVGITFFTGNAKKMLSNQKSILFTLLKYLNILISIESIALIIMISFNILWWLFQTIIYTEMILAGLFYATLSVGLFGFLIKIFDKKDVRRNIIIKMFNMLMVIAGMGLSLLFYLSISRNEIDRMLFQTPNLILIFTLTFFLIIQMLLFHLNQNLPKRELHQQ